MNKAVTSLVLGIYGVGFLAALGLGPGREGKWAGQGGDGTWKDLAGEVSQKKTLRTFKDILK